MIDVDLIVGARPNFIKIAPIIHAIDKYNSGASRMLNYRFIHTGQHYDKNLSDVFFKELQIPEPAINLQAGSGTQAQQTAQIMLGYESLLITKPAKWCLVVGDVTSTLACAIVAKKQQMQLAHIEAGLRSGDRNMPEEINRLVTDSITDLFFTTTPKASQILISEGVAKEKIHFTGNTMIDTLLANIYNLKAPYLISQDNIKENKFILVTLHRPSNVDNVNKLIQILEVIAANTQNLPIIFPIHPRTKKVLEQSGYNNMRFKYTEPLPYLEFMYLVKNCMMVITDSGGITEETTVLGKPCLTLRNTTERPETVTIGTNELVGDNPVGLVQPIHHILNGNWKKGTIPELWDGKAAERIIAVLVKKLSIEKIIA